MGGWELFCAVCGSTFSSSVDIDCENTDEWAYREAVLEESDVSWLDRVRGLGINPDASGEDKSFLTGVGRYWDYGEIVVPPDDDPNSPFQNEEGHPIGYYDWSRTERSHIFPFHSICYEHILQRCIQQAQPGPIRKDALFQLFEESNTTHRYVRLNFHYGTPDPPSEQTWECIQGQEILVANPLEIPQLVSEMSPITDLDLRPGSQINSPSRDIFHRLPLELRHEIINYLPVASVLAIKAASWSMHTTAISTQAWTQRLRDELPWLWEIHEIDLFQSQVMEERASNFLTDIDKKSQYTTANDNYILGLANRRRIWGVCEDIRELYVQKIS